MLFVPPFAEEMNKSRRMVALQARALAADGWTVLVPDLYGCGDSDGDFADADWAQWREDVLAVTHWLRAQSGYRPVLWALRAGCLLASDAARDIDYAADFVLWQPQISGRQALQQFLRLRVSQQALAETSSLRTSTQDLREELRRGQTIEVAGYALPPGIALGLEDAEFAPPPKGVRIACFEIVSSEHAGATPAVRARVDAWEAAGTHATLRAISGAPFWQTQEIAECPALVEATRAAVAGWLQ